MKPIVAALIAAFLAPCARAQNTAFMYQGSLTSGGLPADGFHDFRFKLFDAPSGGSQIGQTQCVDNAAVAAGLFTTRIDFGQRFATPDQRFIEIQRSWAHELTQRERGEAGCVAATEPGAASKVLGHHPRGIPGY